MKHKIRTFFLASTLAATSAWAQPPAPAVEAPYIEPDVQLSLLFQGVAEGVFSRSLRLFGGTGSCEAWYSITEVLAAPSDMNIQSGDRLKLNYRCGNKRAFLPGETAQQAWAQDNGAFAESNLYSGEMVLERTNIWEIPNEDNRFAPVSVQPQQ